MAEYGNGRVVKRAGDILQTGIQERVNASRAIKPLCWCLDSSMTIVINADNILTSGITIVIQSLHFPTCTSTVHQLLHCKHDVSNHNTPALPHTPVHHTPFHSTPGHSPTPDMPNINLTKKEPFSSTNTRCPGPEFRSLLGHMLEGLSEMLLTEGQLASGPDLGILKGQPSQP